MHESHLLYTYDRTPNGGQCIAEDMDDTHSVWIVRATVKRAAN